MNSPEQIQTLRDDLYIASGSAHPRLAEETASAMNVALGPLERKQFPNTEHYVRFEDSVRGKHMFAIQTMAAVEGRSVNDAVVELILMVDSAKRSSASEITVVAPYLSYSRQDRKARGREPISAAAIVRAIQSAGADRLVSIDMHSPQTQGTFNGPFDHLTAESLIQKGLEDEIAAKPEDYVVVSPDGGRAKLAEDYALELGVDVLHIPKSRNRESSGIITRPATIQGVDGKSCIMVDDMIDTAGTLVTAAETLQRSGAARTIVSATHAIFSHPALDRLEDAPIDLIMVTDTIPTDVAESKLHERLRILRIAPLLGEALGEIALQGSVSRIFNDRNHQ